MSRNADVGLPEYPIGIVYGPCVCGGWPGGECFHCAIICSRYQAFAGKKYICAWCGKVSTNANDLCIPREIEE